MTKRKRWLGLGVVCASTFVISIDNTVLNVALPTLAREVNASTAELQWIIDAYVLSIAGLLLTAGSLGDRFGRAHALRLGLVVFGGSSAIAAWSSSPTALIVCRAVMGIGGALIVTCSMSLLINIFTDPKERAQAIGTLASLGGLGLALGPVIGGLLLKHFWWGSVFLVNIPIVIIVVTASVWLLPDSKDPNPGRLDPVGVVLSIVGISTLVWAVIEAPGRGWTSTSTLTAFAGSSAVFVAFVVWELRCDHPMLELSFFKNARFTAANGALVAGNFAFGGALFVLALLLQSVYGYSPLSAGVHLLPLAVAFMSMGYLSPRVAERFGTTRTVAAGLAVVAGGMLVLALLGEHGPLAAVLSTLALGGGFGMALSAGTDAVMGSVPRDKAGSASGTYNTTRQMGTAIGVAVVGSLLASGYRSAITDRTAGIGLSRGQLATARESVGAALELGREIGGTTGRRLGEVGPEAFVHGMRLGLTVAAFVVLVGAVLAVVFIPPRAREDLAVPAVGGVLLEPAT